MSNRAGEEVKEPRDETGVDAKDLYYDVYKPATYCCIKHFMPDPKTCHRTKQEVQVRLTKGKVQEMGQTRNMNTGYRERLVGVELARASKIEVRQAMEAVEKNAKGNPEFSVGELPYNVCKAIIYSYMMDMVLLFQSK